MVVDSSALIASLAGEPDAEIFRSALQRAPMCSMSALNVLESRVVAVMRFGEAMLAELDLLLVKLPVQIVALDDGQAALAFAAYRRFGEGTGHRAALNLGNCAAYALARSLDQPLLFKGDDFIHTDVRAALA
jgi:ribonuclease VapC